MSFIGWVAFVCVCLMFCFEIHNAFYKGRSSLAFGKIFLFALFILLSGKILGWF